MFHISHVLGSAGELLEPTTRHNNTNNTDDSPSKRNNKKWFGLFSKSKTSIEEDGPKAPMYRKKGSGRHNLVISSPTSIPSEDDALTSSVDSDSDEGVGVRSWDGDDGSGGGGDIVPLSQMQDVDDLEELEVRKCW